MANRLGAQTVALTRNVSVAAGASFAGRKEGEGPLRERFDEVGSDAYFGQKTWEKAESVMLRRCFELLCKKGNIAPAQLDYLLAGDLQSQCTASAFAARESAVPFLGLYGACSTMGEAMSVGALLIDGGAAEMLCAMTSSHFCSAEQKCELVMAQTVSAAPPSMSSAPSVIASPIVEQAP